MPVIEDNLWKHPGHPGMIVVSSHSYVDRDGRLFMGYGPAQEAIRRIPDIEQQCGSQVLAHSVSGVYGFLPVRPYQPEQKVVGFGIFQTRLTWEDGPDPEIIKYSMECLRHFSQENNDLRIRMNFPGVGEGGLPAEEIAPLLIPLPQSVTVCHQGEVRRSIPTNFPGFKTLYVQVERMLQEGRHNLAVEHLMNNGFDIQSAMDQVNAVQRCLRERTDRDVERVQRWRSSSYSR